MKAEIEQLQQTLEYTATAGETSPQLSNRLKLLQYQYEHHINPEPEGALHWITADMQGLFIKNILPLVMLFLGADIISREVSNKSIKRLLLSPLGRWRILLSKWLALILISAYCVTLYFAMILCAGLYFEGIQWGTGSYAITLDNIRYHTVSTLSYVIIGYLFNLVTIATISAVILFFSYLLRISVAFSVSVSMIFLLVADAFLKQFTDIIPLIRYYPTYHLDLLSPFSGNNSLSVFSASGSLAVLAATTLLCLGSVYLLFRKQDM